MFITSSIILRVISKIQKILLIVALTHCRGERDCKEIRICFTMSQTVSTVLLAGAFLEMVHITVIVKHFLRRQSSTITIK